MAYDKELADRIRALLPNDAAVSEQAMFGGLAFLVGGNMAIAASGQGGLLVRVDPGSSEQLMATTTAVPMEMRGRPMRGWLRVGADQVRTKRQLSKWIDLGVGYARSLPSKR
ncbi:MAG: TfoX/Sxy family protein [Actinomycetota bacterium]|nr:TfoX/Sxy family protein [Actinomycetota bacterium]